MRCGLSALLLGEHHDECISSLQFAHRCSHVQTQPKVNYEAVDPAEQQQRIVKLSNELAGLKGQLESIHAHYQKELEAAAADPEYARQLGPVERSDAETDSDYEQDTPHRRFSGGGGGRVRGGAGGGGRGGRVGAGGLPGSGGTAGRRGGVVAVPPRGDSARGPGGRPFTGRDEGRAAAAGNSAVSAGEVAKLRERAQHAEAEVVMTQETAKALTDKLILMESTFSGEKRALAAERAVLRDTAQEEHQRHVAKIKEMEAVHVERFALHP